TPNRGQIMTRNWLVLFGFILAGGSAYAAGPALTAAEIKTMLSKGMVVTSTDMQDGKVYTARINLAADGQLSGSLTPAGDAAIAISGRWQVKGNQLCRTLGPVQPDEVCETWFKSGDRQIIIQVGGKEVAKNRW